MIETGKYQNQITSLSALDIESYERIFKVYYISSDDKKFPYYNILKKIEISDINSDFVDHYDVLVKTPMTTVSHKIYGNIKSWWILYVLNKDLFEGPPFWVEGGKRLKFIKPEYLTYLYLDITQNTIYQGRHY